MEEEWHKSHVIELVNLPFMCKLLFRKRWIKRLSSEKLSRWTGWPPVHSGCLGDQPTDRRRLQYRTVISSALV